MLSSTLARTFSAAAVTLFGATGVSATPVTYGFALSVESVSYGSLGQSGCQAFVASSPSPLMGCAWQPNDQLAGTFSLASGVDGLSDGVYSFIPLLSWAIEIGELRWDLSEPSPASAFSGFRDGLYCGGAGVGLGGANPGLQVEGGEVVGFCGGVFGSSDTPFIDFDYAAGPGHFSAFDGVTRLEGTYQIHLVPEPSSLALAVLACVAGLRAKRVGVPNRKPRRQVGLP